jgi:hypothetical protein
MGLNSILVRRIISGITFVKNYKITKQLSEALYLMCNQNIKCLQNHYFVNILINFYTKGCCCHPLFLGIVSIRIDFEKADQVALNI